MWKRPLPKPSKPLEKRFVYSYTITITNHGDTPARLVSRHWLVRDDNDDVQEVTGEGVVGQQPRLLPGEGFTYTSGVVLATQSGTMEGSYQMQTDAGEPFEAPVPLFALVPPHAIH
ncbi:Co2+/Mg2+ efflux protein ApaG [Gilvimarinus sp. F26214L]|uniref:Co2+/Mg2+ efflux protein ApaG n=1 Tax=Gilvimarinus sp. DZF01 TaxID=3461371 RepID=UPI004045A4F8